MPVRSAIPSDLPVMAELWYAKMTLLRQFDSRICLLPDARVRWQERVSGWLDEPSYIVLVIAQNEQIPGYLIGCQRANAPGLDPEKVGVIRELVTELHTQQKGIGRRLFQSFRDWCVDRALSRVIVEAPQQYAVEQAFWRGIGAKHLWDLFEIKL